MCRYVRAGRPAERNRIGRTVWVRRSEPARNTLQRIACTQCVLRKRMDSQYKRASLHAHMRSSRAERCVWWGGVRQQQISRRVLALTIRRLLAGARMDFFRSSIARVRACEYLQSVDRTECMQAFAHARPSTACARRGASGTCGCSLMRARARGFAYALCAYVHIIYIFRIVIARVRSVVVVRTSEICRTKTANAYVHRCGLCCIPARPTGHKITRFRNCVYIGFGHVCTCVLEHAPRFRRLSPRTRTRTPPNGATGQLHRVRRTRTQR